MLKGVVKKGFRREKPTAGFAPESSAEKPKSKRRTPNKKLIGLVIYVLVLSVLGVLIAINLSHKPAKFKTITYSNGQGDKFNFQFYDRYSVRKYKNPLSTSANTNNETGPNQLVSEVSKDGKAPIVLSIVDYSTENTSFLEHEKSCGDSPTIMKVSNKFVGKTILVCGFSSKLNGENQDITYSADFITKGRAYRLAINQNVVSNKNDKDFKSVESQFGLQVYKEDIQKILTSLQPL